MNTNTDTVLKLSDALTELIAAYEKLQQQNDDLNAKNEALEAEINELKNEKTSLESTYNQLNETTEKQETNINSMLGKIESLLGVNKSSKKELKDIIVQESEDEYEDRDEAQELEESIFNTPAQHETTKSDISDIALNNDSSVQEDEIDSITSDEQITTKEEEEGNKLDLNRMASLLNGFNK